MSVSLSTRKTITLESRPSLISVYDHPDPYHLLYLLLSLRPAEANISHSEMPSWKDHVKFVESEPYEAWYIIEDDNEEVGAVYLTKKGEIGIGILPAFQRLGIAKKAVESIMMLHRRDKYYANIAPFNEKSENLFVGLGFRHIQNTFVLE